MTRFSARLAVPLAVLLAIFLIPIGYARLVPENNECPSDSVLLDSAALDPRLEVITGGPKATNLELGRLLARLPRTEDGSRPFLVAVQRTFGLPNRIFQPASALPGRREPDDISLEIVPTRYGDLPLYHAYERRGRSVRVTAYFMTHRLKGIRNPLWTRLEHGPAAALGGSWPITLFAIAGRAHPSKLDPKLAKMDAWLLEAWSYYQAACGPPADSRGHDDRAS